MKLTIRLVTGVLSLTTTALAADPARPVGETVAEVFYEGLKRRGVAERYAAHEAFAAARFEASRGEKTFSDKTGNCRLAWVERLITKQVDSIGEADRFTRELFDAAAAPDGLPRVVGIAATKLDAGEIAATQAAAANAGSIERLTAMLAAARAATDAAIAPLSEAERAELRQHLYQQTTGGLTLGHRFVDKDLGRRVADLLEKMDRQQLLAVAGALAAFDAMDWAAAAPVLGTMDAAVAAPAGVKGDVRRVVPTPHGTIVVGGDGANEYALDADGMADVALVIDVGGDDTYVEGTTSEKRPVLIVIDLAGNDTYRGERPGIQGGAVLGSSLLLEVAGNDNYTALDVAQGATLGGAGLLIDRAGDDTYKAERRVQGSAVGGVGLLLDRAGNDKYRAALLAQGVGGPLGFGALADIGDGADHYFAGGKYLDGYEDSPGFASFSQGVGVGPRGVANGGIGTILDGGGDDVYEGDCFAHGGGYWFAAGFARDFGGNDQRVGATRENFDGTPRTEPRFVRWGVGYGCHYAAGFIFDDAGNDTYVGDHAVIAFGWDIAVTGILDRAGDDQYTATTSGGATAFNSSMAVIYDGGGRDTYSAPNLASGPPAADYHPEAPGNFSLLLDEGGGEDTYPAEIKNGAQTLREWPGAVVCDR